MSGLAKWAGRTLVKRGSKRPPLNGGDNGQKMSKWEGTVGPGGGDRARESKSNGNGNCWKRKREKGWGFRGRGKNPFGWRTGGREKTQKKKREESLKKRVCGRE